MKDLSKHLLLCVAIIASAWGWTSVAHAQQDNHGASSDNGGIETVTVTAERRSETTQNVAGQITALTGADLSQYHANTFADFADYVPGVSFASGGPTSNLIAIRGVTTGTGQLGSAIGLYFDDVPLGASTQFGEGFLAFNVNTFDLDRIEVLNGPQGTLYGANALGGTLRYITQKPDLNNFSAQAEAEGSSTDHGSYNDGLRLMVNLPLFDGQAAFRVDGLQEFDSGYAQDPVYGRKNVGSGRTLAGRVSFEWQVTPDLDVRLSAVSQGIKGDGADVALRDPTTHKPVIGDYNQAYPLSQPSDFSLTVYSAVVDWDLHWAKLTSVTGYQRDVGKYSSDVSTFYDTAFFLYDTYYGADDNFVDPYALLVNDTTRKFTQEVRLSSPDNKVFEWVIGGFFDREITDESVDLVDGSTPDGTVPAGYTGTGALPFFGYLPSTYRELAAYADGTFFVTDNFDVTAGIRYSNQHQTYGSYISSIIVPSPTFPMPYTTYHYEAGSNGGVTTYLFNPRWHVTDDTMLYARVSSGFRPGGPNFVLPASSLPPTFQPDKLWNYEIGEKSTLLDGRATLDADIYDIEWTSLQATENVEGINQLVNAGNARIKGAEASFAFRVLPELTLGGSASYTDAKLVSTSPVLGVYYKGARLPLSPKFNFALDANYTFDIGDGFSGAANLSDVYVGGRTEGYKGSALNPLYTLPSYNTVNFNLAIFMPHNMELDAYVKNIFDVEGQVSANTLNNAFIPTAPVPVNLSLPRTIGLVLKVGIGQ